MQEDPTFTPKKITKIRLPHKDEETKHMADSVFVERLKFLINMFAVKYGVKKQSKNFKVLNFITKNAKEYYDTYLTRYNNVKHTLNLLDL